MTFTYSTFQLAEERAERLTNDACSAMAVFADPMFRNFDDSPMIGVSALAEYHPQGRDLLVIYEPRS